MQKRVGQRTTLVIHDPCPGYVPPEIGEREETQQSHQQGLVQENQKCEYDDVMEEDVDMDFEQDECNDLSLNVYQSDEDTHEKTSLDNDHPTVVLDCANIGWEFGKDEFNAHGVQLAYQYFAEFTVNIIGFLPAKYYKRRPKDGSRGNAIEKTEGWEILDSLVRSDQLVIVPAGDSDDLYILQYARMNQGFVVSNDFYSDHIRSLEGDVAEQTATWLEESRCPYTFIKKGHQGMFMPSPGSTMMEVLENYRPGNENNDCDEMEMDTVI